MTDIEGILTILGQCYNLWNNNTPNNCPRAQIFCRHTAAKERRVRESYPLTNRARGPYWGILARGPGSTDQAQRGPYKNDRGQYIYLINQERGPYWENIDPRSWQYGPSAARFVQKRPRADILPIRFRACLVNKRFITLLKKAKTAKTQVRDHSGQCPVQYFENIYWTGNRAFSLVDFSYWPSDCLSRVIIFIICC